MWLDSASQPLSSVSVCVLRGTDRGPVRVSRAIENTLESITEAIKGDSNSEASDNSSIRYVQVHIKGKSPSTNGTYKRMSLFLIIAH